MSSLSEVMKKMYRFKKRSTLLDLLTFLSINVLNIYAVENLFDDIPNSVNVDCHILSNYSLHTLTF